MENEENRAVNFSLHRLSFFDALTFRLDSREVSVFREARAEVAGGQNACFRSVKSRSSVGFIMLNEMK